MIIVTTTIPEIIKMSKEQSNSTLFYTEPLQYSLGGSFNNHNEYTSSEFTAVLATSYYSAIVILKDIDKYEVNTQFESLINNIECPTVKVEEISHSSGSPIEIKQF